MEIPIERVLEVLRRYFGAAAVEMAIRIAELETRQAESRREERE